MKMKYAILIKVKSLLKFFTLFQICMIPTIVLGQYEPILNHEKEWHASAYRFSLPERNYENYHLGDTIIINDTNYVGLAATSDGLTPSSYQALYREDNDNGVLYMRAFVQWNSGDTAISPEIEVCNLSLEENEIYYQKYIVIFGEGDPMIIDSLEHLVTSVDEIEGRQVIELEIVPELNLFVNELNPWNVEFANQMTSTVIKQTYIEGVGSNFGLLFPIVMDGPNFPKEPYLLCAFESNDLVWVDPKVSNCSHPVDFILSFEEERFNKIKIYPNPVENDVWISGMIGKATDLTITDIVGKTHLFKRIQPNTSSNLKLDLSHLEVGIYVLNLKQEGKKILVSTLIKN